MLLPKTLLAIYSVELLCTYALVVPEDVDSALSHIRGLSTPVKKGTDSRLGFGFRLGEHADFQVLLDLGLQKETRPIGKQDSDSTKNRRQINKTEQNILIQQKKLQQNALSAKRNAANLIENLSKNMSFKLNQRKTKNHQNEKTNLLPILPMLPTQSLLQLQLLYKMAKTTITPKTEKAGKTSAEPTAITDAQTMDERLTRKAQITKEFLSAEQKVGE